MTARVPFNVAAGAGKIYKETLRLQWKRTINRMLPCVRLKTQVRMIMSVVPFPGPLFMSSGNVTQDLFNLRSRLAITSDLLNPAGCTLSS